MKQELYRYATSLPSKPLSKLPVFWFRFLLAMFLIAIMVFNMPIGLAILFSYVFLCLLLKREVDEYRRGLLNLGLFLFFLAIESSTLLLILFHVFIPLILTVTAVFVSYEILFLVKIKRKVYSRGTPMKSSWMNIIPLIFGSSGVYAGKLLAKVGSINFNLCVMIFICSFLIVYSCTFFQKYFVHKFII